MTSVKCEILFFVDTCSLGDQKCGVACVAENTLKAPFLL